MSSFLYSLLPARVIRAIRRRRDYRRRYKLALRDLPKIYGTHVDPL